MEMVVVGHFAYFDQPKKKKSALSYYMDLELIFDKRIKCINIFKLCNDNLSIYIN